MKRTPLQRKTALRPRTPLKRAKRPLGASKRPLKPRAHKLSHKGYKPPQWFRDIVPGSHGNTPAQKRLWRVVSEKVRKEDFKKYGGKCVSCPAILPRWQDGQCAHFKRYSVCNAWFKYELKNLALSCPGCNQNDDGVVGHAFGEELKRRHGPDIIEWINAENEKYRGQKMEVWEIVAKAAELLGITDAPAASAP